VTALIVVFCPATAAIILVYRENKTAGVRDLLKRSFDYKRIKAKIWYAPILLLMPVVTILSYGWMRWIGVSLPIPQAPVVATLAMSLAIFILALGEELGWSGYAIDPMQDRWGALPASILLGLVWALWHIVPLVQVHRSPAWIAWWCLGTVAARVLTTINVTWQLFPIHGSYFDPCINGVIMAIAAVVVVTVWGPRTLAGYKMAV
jgi:membrane protease YdiL (CAAX protease family)